MDALSAGLNRAWIGREVAGDTQVADAAAMAAFARAVGDENPRYVDPGAGLVAHPLFVVRLLRGLMPKMLGDPALRCDLARMVHGEQAFHYFRPIRPGDAVALTGAVTGIEDKPSGQRLLVEQRLRVGGELAVRGEAVAFIRALKPGPGPAKSRSAPNAAPEPPTAAPDFAASREVSEDQARVYADASGDRNPIHLEEAAARAAGLPGIILHGTATLVVAAGVIVDRVLGGDPLRLRSLSVRFARPLTLPNRLTIHVWRDAAVGGIRFRAMDQAGEVVLDRGTAQESP